MEKSVITAIINEINPISVSTEKLNGKYCKIMVTDAKIDGNIIKADGIFIINKKLWMAEWVIFQK